MTPGWKTSEFWLTLVTQAIGAVAASGAATGSPWVQATGVATAALAALGYNVSRAQVKSKSMSEAFGAKPVEK